MKCAGLFVDEADGIADAGARGAVAVGLVLAVGISERDAAYHPAVVAEAEMPAHHLGMERQRGLRYRGDSQCLRRQQEARDIPAAIDRAVDAERLVRMH